MPQKLPPILEYANLLHKHHDPGAPQVQQFLQKHRDAALHRRVKVLNKLFALKQAMEKEPI